MEARFELLRRCKLGPFRLGRALELYDDSSKEVLCHISARLGDRKMVLFIGHTLAKLENRGPQVDRNNIQDMLKGILLDRYI